MDTAPLKPASPQDARRNAIAQALGHSVEDRELMLLACTHASVLDAQADRGTRVRKSNERLEFLGDTLLDAAMGELLYDQYPDADEGTLSRYKSRLVSRPILARAIERLELLPHCVVGDKMQGEWPDSVKANFAESLLALVYKDGGWAAVKVAVQRLLGHLLSDIEQVAPDQDAKSRLQDWALKTQKRLPQYQSRRCGGTDHAPEFHCQVQVAQHSAEGTGGSRRAAEVAAANALLASLDETPIIDPS